MTDDTERRAESALAPGEESAESAEEPKPLKRIGPSDAMAEHDQEALRAEAEDLVCRTVQVTRNAELLDELYRELAALMGDQDEDQA